MLIGVTLPMRAFDGDELHGWAEAVEDGPFDSISCGERLAYENHDSLIAMAALAGATERVLLTTGVNVLPLHREVIFAKQCASLDRLSGGRFRLGVGVGPREQDFAVAQVTWDDRAQRFEEQFATMKRVWAGEPPFPGTEPVGPPPVTPGGPEVHIGGFAPRALRRCGRLADGLRSFDFAPDPAIHLDRYAIVTEAWNAAGRSGRPKLLASTYFALGPDARKVYDDSMRPYYGYDDAMMEWAGEDTALVTPTAIIDAVRRFEDAGVDEMGFTAASLQGPECVHRLAEVIGRIR